MHDHVILSWFPFGYLIICFVTLIWSYLVWTIFLEDVALSYKKVLMPSCLYIWDKHDRMRVILLYCNISTSTCILILINFACMDLRVLIQLLLWDKSFFDYILKICKSHVNFYRVKLFMGQLRKEKEILRVFVFLIYHRKQFVFRFYVCF